MIALSAAVAMSIAATGQVYNLNALDDFPGNYWPHRSVYTIGERRFAALLEVVRDVQIYLEGHITGMRSSMGMSSVEIQCHDPV